LILQSRGFEVGLWLMSSTVADDPDLFQYKLKSNGEAAKPWLCHADEKLLQLAEEHMRLFAKTGASLIMFDDDLHHSHYSFEKNGLRGCACPAHRALMREMYGDSVDFDKVMEEASADKPNESRKIWMSVMAAALEKYARRLRAAVDEVNPEIRMGFATCVPNHGIEGSSFETLSAIFAGKNKPFGRYIGAAYWYDNAYGGRANLGHIIEIERWQSARYKMSGIESMSEGDVFPRPRTAVPAAILECLDMALRADGNNDGILKYMIPYYSHANYDLGYIDRHCLNKPVYEAISRHFSEKTSVGIRVYSNDRVFSEYDLAYDYLNHHHGYKDMFVMQPAGFILSLLSLPTTYDGRAVATAVFGEQARFVEKDVLDTGTILDYGAAVALTARGIDVGLRGTIGPNTKARGEDFGHNEFLRIMQPGGGTLRGLFSIQIDEKAQVLSRYVDRMPRFEDELAEMPGVPAAYLYENADGQRFCVLAFSAMCLANLEFLSYAKTRQLAQAAEWVSKKKLPAVCFGNPKMYMMTKAAGDELAVGLWNFSEDKVLQPVVQLSEG